MTDVADAFREAFLEGMQNAVKVLRAAKPGIHTLEIEKYIAQECRDYWDDFNEQIMFGVTEGELTDEELSIIVSLDTVESLGKLTTAFVDIEECPIVEGGFTTLGEADVARFMENDSHHARMMRFLDTVVQSSGDLYKSDIYCPEIPLARSGTVVDPVSFKAVDSINIGSFVTNTTGWDDHTVEASRFEMSKTAVEAKSRKMSARWGTMQGSGPLHGIIVELELFDMLMEEIEREGVAVPVTFDQIDAEVKEEMLANAVRRVMPAHLVGEFEGISPMRAPSTEVHKRRPPTVEMPKLRPVVMKEMAFTPTEMAARADHVHSEPRRVKVLRHPTHEVLPMSIADDIVGIQRVSAPTVTSLSLAAADDAPFKVVEIQDGREVCSATFPQFEGFRPDRHMQVQSKLCDQSMTDEKSSISLRSVSFR